MVFQKFERDCRDPRVRSAADAATPLSWIAYRLLWPREAFFTLALFSPRAPVRGPFGAAFFRAARFTFLRSSLSVMLLVFAMYLANLSISAIFGTQRRSNWANFSTSFFTP